MLGDKDHQFFDITAAAYVSSLTPLIAHFHWFSKEKTEKRHHGHVEKHGKDMQAFENSILNHLIRGNQSFIEETFNMDI